MCIVRFKAHVILTCKVVACSVLMDMCTFPSSLLPCQCITISVCTVIDFVCSEYFYKGNYNFLKSLTEIYGQQLHAFSTSLTKTYVICYFEWYPFTFWQPKKWTSVRLLPLKACQLVNLYPLLYSVISDIFLREIIIFFLNFISECKVLHWYHFMSFFSLIDKSVIRFKSAVP